MCYIINLMIGDIISSISEAEKQAARILSNAEVVIRKIDKKTQTDIEDMKMLQAKELGEKIKAISSAQAAGNDGAADIKIDKIKFEDAKKYIILNLLGGEK